MDSGRSEDSKPSNATPSSDEVPPERPVEDEILEDTSTGQGEESVLPHGTCSAWDVEEQLQETFLAQKSQARQSPLIKRGSEQEEASPDSFTQKREKEHSYESQLEPGEPLPEPYTAQDERPQAHIVSPAAPATASASKAVPKAIPRQNFPPNSKQSPRVQAQLEVQARPIPNQAKPNFSAFEQSPIRSPDTATREWSRTVQPYSASPFNLINLSESPQTVPSSFDEKSDLGGWSQRDDYRTAERAATQYSLSTSPPTHTTIAPSFTNRRPLSGQHLDRKSIFEDTMSRQPRNNYGRRNSGYSQLTDRHRTPPQHGFPQPSHIYGAPDINLGGGKRSNGLKPGERGYYCGFDTMNVVKGGRAKNTPVIIAGYEGGLDIRHANKRGATQIAQLGGLRGGVYNAKILPWTIDSGPWATRDSTLIVVVVHGPVLEDATDVGFGEEAGDEMRNRRSGSTTGTEAKRKNSIHRYQTTVEVYDVRTQRYIATLLTIPPVELKMAYMGPRFTPPLPSGALSIQADAGNIVFTSGQTGELWIFKHAKVERNGPLQFKCLGKYWTTVQQPPTPEPVDYSQRPDSERSGGVDKVKKIRAKTGLVSLRGRWLAFCPSQNIHATRLGAFVDTSLSSRPVSASVNTYAPPQLPSTTCAVDTPPGDDWKARLGRQAAQGAITGANYVYGQTSKALKNYWNPPTQTAQGWQPAAAQPQVFPPTHSSTAGKQTTVSDIAHVSIIDLHKLANLPPGKKMSTATVATFKLVSGCSYLSLSPLGLHLFTANSNGDRQYIWDLYRCQFPKPSPLTLLRAGYPATPHVRQICGFSRLTSARIVDVVWTHPGGRTVAMVTERNTVHFLDIPRHLFYWPPPRRPRAAVQTSDANGSRSVSAAPAAAVKIAGSAISSVRGFAGGWMGRRQSNASDQPPSTLAKQEAPTSSFNGSVPSRTTALATTLGTYAGVSGKYVAAGLSKSLQATGAAVQQFRRAGDNKLHLPNSESICAQNCMFWLGERKSRKQAFAVVLDGFIKIYTVRYIPSKKGAPGRKREPARIVVKGLIKNVIIPSVSDTLMAEMVKRALDLDEDDLAIGSPSVKAMDDNSRTAVLPVRPFAAGGRGKGADFRRTGGGNAIPMAEIETSSPWRPWCNDHRVSLFCYQAYSLSPPDYNDTPVPDHDQKLAGMFSDQVNLRQTATNKPAHQLRKEKEEDRWAFGLPIEAERIDTGYDDENHGDEEEYEGYGLVRTVSKDGEEPIVSTTRRTKGGDLAMLGEGVDEERGEGFFEDGLEVVEFAGR